MKQEIFSVPEEIVDNSDLGDPEGMLQLSRVRQILYQYSHFLKSLDSSYRLNFYIFPEN